MSVLCAVPWRRAESDSLQKSRDTIGHHTMRTAKKLRAKAIRETWFVLGKLFRSDLKALVASTNVSGKLVDSAMPIKNRE